MSGLMNWQMKLLNLSMLLKPHYIFLKNGNLSPSDVMSDTGYEAKVNKSGDKLVVAYPLIFLTTFAE